MTYGAKTIYIEIFVSWKCQIRNSIYRFFKCNCSLCWCEQAKDITDIGSLKQAAKIFVPGKFHAGTVVWILRLLLFIITICFLVYGMWELVTSFTLLLHLSSFEHLNSCFLHRWCKFVLSTDYKNQGRWDCKVTNNKTDNKSQTLL